MQLFSSRLIDSPITIIGISVAAIFLVVLVKRVLRWTMKLMTILLLICVIIVIALIGYWQNWYSLSSAHDPRQAPTRRAATAPH